MAQNFKRFEQSRAQLSAFPSRFFDNHLQEPTFFRGWLLEE
jgi:hypothetical protein